MMINRTPDMDGATCQEAAAVAAEHYVPCGKPAEFIVWSDRDKRPYAMCISCAHHNVTRRGMALVFGSFTPDRLVTITPRIPAELKDQLNAEAAGLGISLNQLYRTKLARSVQE